MVLTIFNQTATDRFYLSGLVDLPPNGSYTATSSNIFLLSRDSFLTLDCKNNNVFLSDGANIYQSVDAVDYLNLIANSLGGQVVGLIGNTGPSFAIQVGCQDGSGNVQPAKLYNSQISNSDIINSSISSGSITVGTSAVALNVSGSNLTNRKVLIFCPISGTIYWGASSGVTTSTGIPAFPNASIQMALGAVQTLYAIAGSSITVNVFEGA